jgi:hypothetical protein
MSEPIFKLSHVSGVPVSDEVLIADLRRVAKLLGTETLLGDQYKLHGKSSKTTLQNRFGSWNKALLRAGLKVTNERSSEIKVAKDISDEMLKADLRRVSKILATDKLTVAQYKLHGKYGTGSIERRFGTWNKALLQVGLKISANKNIPDIDLFANILTLWQHYGRQPRGHELALAPSNISTKDPYCRRFGSWMNALRAFVDYVNGTGAEAIESTIEEATQTSITKIDENRIDEITAQNTEKIFTIRHKTPRNPSVRLRWHVLQRDNFKCCGCGASPAITLGVELHVDHIDPWSKGGETVLENLQTLCSKCNLGKSNLLPEVTDLLSN